MAVDNPSYFSLHSGIDGTATTTATSTNSSASSRSFGGLFRRSKSNVSTNVATIGNKMVAPTTGRSAVVQPGANGNQRRSLRNLFRSASASADCEKTRQFLKGEPRPSDVAPPSPYLNGRCKSTRRQAPKSTNELLNMDMVFCGMSTMGVAPSVPTNQRNEDKDYYRYEGDSECGSDAATLPIDELEEQPNYYNLTTTLPSMGSLMYSSMGRRKPSHKQQPRRRRRHSIGTFLDRDRGAISSGTSLGSPSKRPGRSTDLVLEPDLAEIGDSNGTLDKFGTRHAATTSPAQGSKPGQDASQNARDDVVFISSKDNEASALWVNYLTACFEQISRQQGRPPFRVSQVTLEEPLGPGAEQRLRSSRLQIVVVCPMFLERVLERPEQTSSITRQLCAEHVLAMMLGVQDAQLNSAHRANLNTYPTWRKFFVKDQDETFVGQFLGAAVAVLASPSPNGLKTDKTVFSVHPKKVKTGHNRILALLNDPLQPNDNVTVTVDRCGEAIEVTQVKRRNPYTLQFVIPERCLDVSMLVGVRITRNGAPLGCRQVKCESRLRELDQILRAHDNPLEFMCQTFGFSSGDKEQLDNWMVHAFQKNIPPHFNLLSNPSGEFQLAKNQSSSEENPTLLHFAARFGLEKLAWQLLECPGGDLACDMRNVNDITPADLAEQAGHIKLAHQLRGYMQMNEFSNMYSYLKVMSENTKGGANGQRSAMDDDALSSVSCSHRLPNQQQQQEDYCRPRPLSEAYAVPPMARPVSNCRGFPDYSMPMPIDPVDEEASSCSASVVTSLSGSNASTPMAIYSSSSTLNASSFELPIQGLRSSNSLSLDSPDGASAATPPSSGASNVTGDGKTGTNDNGSDKSSIGGSSRVSKSSKSDEPQDELLEIITDFKNNVFTISEVERLVETWRNRNDVQQSFKDKQRQLSAMRDEYERIQRRIKDEMKAPTPFDRIRKFFTKGKKDSKDPANTKDYTVPNKQNGVANNLADRRPVSSLSLHSVSSSSSSGRMSTVSGCSGASLGDSGTHSDADDRRLQQHAVVNEIKNSSAAAASVQAVPTGMTNYEIPPAPKPFHGMQASKPHSSAASSRFATPVPSRGGSELDLRPVKSSYPTADDKEYYIEFPPSGLPVHSFKPNGVARDSPVSNAPNALDQPSSNKTRLHQHSSSHANLLPPAPPPPGMCIPFEYVNISPATCTTANITSKPEASNVITVRPEIHAHEDATSDEAASGRISNDDNNEQTEDEVGEQSQGEDITPESPKILNTELPEYTNVQIAASEEIARNFGVTLKRLPAPPVPPRCEFSFPDANAAKNDGVDTTE